MRHRRLCKDIHIQEIFKPWIVGFVCNLYVLNLALNCYGTSFTSRVFSRFACWTFWFRRGIDDEEKMC
jgi:hypothetical protein